MSKSIDSLLEFVSFTHEVRKVKRSMWVLDEEQFENDSEHSFQVAMVALYVIEQNGLELDAYKSMALALVHDILEVHSGDTHLYGKKSELDSKQAREQKAIAKLKSQWPQINLLHELIDEYENRSSAESRFIYALDKLIPILNNYLDDGRNWKREKITLDQVISKKSSKIEIDKDVSRYYKEILSLLEQRPELFR